MKKTIFLVLAAVLLVYASAGCIAEDEGVIPDKYISNQGYYYVWIYVDESTGVEYLVYDGGYDGGICPRYNADGTLKINERFKK